MTGEYWRNWLASGHFPDHRWRTQLQRSALTLKGLTYVPTGATVAAADHLAAGDPRGRAQLGLPLLLDARRDVHAVGSARARVRLGGRRLHAVRRRPRARRRRRPADHVRTRRRARPHRARARRPLRLRGVRAGPRSATVPSRQRQNDVFGAVLDSVYLHTKMGGHIPERLWPVLLDQVRSAIAVWDKPDQGIWEARGEPKHYVSSKLMCWVAVRPRLAAGRDAGRVERAPPSGARPPTGSARTSSPAACRIVACSASTTRPTRSTPRRC